MNFVLSAISLITSAEPTDGPEWNGDVDLVTPGVVGFVITALIALATVFLLIDMTRRIRRLRYREEIREKLAAEQSGDAESLSSSEVDPETDLDPPRA